MDSLDSSSPPHSAPPNMAVGAPPAYSPSISNAGNNAASTTVLNPSPTRMIPPSALFPYNSMIAPATLPPNAVNAPTYGGSHSESLNVDSGKRKRGRPRKYAPDGGAALRLGPTTTTAGPGDSSGAPDSENPAKKPRGRPAGSGKKQTTTIGPEGFTLHAVMAKPGEDVAAKVVSFSQQGPRTVFIISANGTIQSATLRHAARSGGSSKVAYEGPFEMVSMSGCFVLSENNGNRSKTGGLSVLLAAPEGRIFGGGVAGMLMAGSQVQVLIGSFLEDKKRSNPCMVNSESPSVPSQRINASRGEAAVAAVATASNSPSSGESSAGNGGSSVNNRQPGLLSNRQLPAENYMQQQQQQMYHKLWAPR